MTGGRSGHPLGVYDLLINTNSLTGAAKQAEKAKEREESDAERHRNNAQLRR